jgi:SAM-dependent methyltransferase
MSPAPDPEPSSSEAAYDRWAADYRDWWAPVIAPWGLRLLDALYGLASADGPATIVDSGTGTGTLALAALRRWPRADVIGVDPARRLLEMAEADARRLGVDGRFAARVGEAGALPLSDASADAAASSFVLQLTPSRTAAVREARRVLRPGGTFAHLTWLIDDEPWEPEDVFDDALDALRIEPPERSGGGDRAYTTPAAAADELRRAGFRSVRAERVWMEHPFTPSGYADLAEHWTEEDTFATLEEPMLRRLRAEVVRRLERLPADALMWRRPLVMAVGRRPG